MLQAFMLVSGSAGGRAGFPLRALMIALYG
jgi:hypothetical protein